MLNYSETTIDSIIAHRIGRRAEKDSLICSDILLPVPEGELLDDLLLYFFGSFKEPIFYSFRPVTESYHQNNVYQLVHEILKQPERLDEHSRALAKLLYDESTHPNIKAGDLFVFYFYDVLIEDELLSGIGICKAESKESFLQLDHADSKFQLKTNRGIALKSIDKACLIFDLDQDQGYKCCVVDRSNDREAKFWIQDFLNMDMNENDYFQTKEYIKMTKSFVQDHMQPMYETSGVEEAEVMHRSKNFFTAEEKFNEEDYAHQVFPDKELAADFVSYRQDHEESTGRKFSNEFDIAEDAVKKQSRYFKSVLKLDKNFHIYIHGNRDMIERGTDADGRKYYKVFYEEEK